MSGPTTEAVNDDVKELRGELHRVEVSLTRSIAGVDAKLSRLEGEFATFKWMLGATLGLLISGAAAAIWSSGSTSAKLDAMDARIGRIEAAVARIVEHQQNAPRPEAPR